MLSHLVGPRVIALPGLLVAVLIGVTVAGPDLAVCGPHCGGRIVQPPPAAALVYLPPRPGFFGTAPLTPGQLATVATFPFIVWGADEVRRTLIRRRRQAHAAAKGDFRPSPVRSLAATLEACSAGGDGAMKLITAIVKPDRLDDVTRAVTEASLAGAISLQRIARTLIALAERWSSVEPAAEPVASPFAGAPDLNDDRAIETSGVLFMEGGGEPAEIARIKSELETMAVGSEQVGSWLASVMEASWGWPKRCCPTRSSPISWLSGTGSLAATGRMAAPHSSSRGTFAAPSR